MNNSNNSDKKAQFHDALSFLVESANINSGVLTMDEIKNALDGIIEDESMYTLVYNYLVENKIKIQGYISYTKNNSNESLDEISVDTKDDDIKEQNIINMYLDDVKNAILLSENDELNHLSDLLNKDVDDDCLKKTALNSLIETNLNLVTKIADNYKNKGVSYGDLLQEGNLGLIDGIMTYNSIADLTEFHKYLTVSIKNAITNAIIKQDSSARIGTHIADRANELDRASINLSKELDRTPTLEELAKYLSLPEDEVERIMKMSLDALTIDNSIEDEN